MHIIGFGGDHRVLVMRGRTREGLERQVRFWAERGIIHCEDSLDNSYTTMTVRSFLRRAKAECEMLGNSDPSRDRGADADLRLEILRVVERAQEIAAQAQEQGMPEDASARRDLARRRPKTLCLTPRGGIM